MNQVGNGKSETIAGGDAMKLASVAAVRNNG
jgi:hypothetical protein